MKNIEEKYNGWANKDTWAVALWLNNDKGNYRTLKDNNNGDKMYYSDDKLVLTLLKKFYYGDDKINWSNVDIKEIKELVLVDFIVEDEE